MRPLDRIGISLSALCALHCLLTPVVILFLPLMARYYLAHPYFHLGMAALILPIGLFSFVKGVKVHGEWSILIFGCLGLVLVGLLPVLFHSRLSASTEPLVMVIGSALLIFAHWRNRVAYHRCDDARCVHSRS